MILLFLLHPMGVFANPETFPDNCISLQGQNDSAFLPIPDKVLKQKKLFLVGETHGVSSNPIVMLKCIRYLYEYAGMRRLLIEASPGEAFLYNQYLGTGDENTVSLCWDFRTKEYQEYWREVFAFNATKSAGERIKVIGLDFESDIAFARVIEIMKPKDKVPPLHLQPLLDSLSLILAKKGRPDYLHRNLFLSFVQNYQKDKSSFEIYFGKYFASLLPILGNKASFQMPKFRDEEMVANFYAQTDWKDTTVSYFGSLGCQHTYLNDGHSFACLLNKQNLKDKVLSIPVYYDNCFSYYKRKVVLIQSGFLQRFLSRRNVETAEIYFRSLTTCNEACFKLDESTHETATLGLQCQYVLYMKDKRPVTPVSADD